MRSRSHRPPSLLAIGLACQQLQPKIKDDHKASNPSHTYKKKEEPTSPFFIHAKTVSQINQKGVM